MMGTDRSQAAIAFQQKNADALKASRGAFTTPTLGPTAGSWTAPMAKAVKSVSPGGGNSRRSYTAPKAKSSMGSGSSWKRSYSGGF
jgi:hypothetical protein